MKRLRSMLLLLALVLFASFALSCGSGQGGLRQLQSIPPQSITLSPATADAGNYPNGQVPFTATGYYVNPPHTVTLQSANWNACQQNGVTTTEVSLSQAGMAQCAVGAAGTYSINAWVATSDAPCGIDTCGILLCAVVGTAQLTCP